MVKKLHYAPNGEWGQTRTNCGRYYTAEVALAYDIRKVTCKHCLKLINKQENN